MNKDWNEGVGKFEVMGGQGRLRDDGSVYSCEEDRQAFAAEEWGCRQFGKEPRRKVRRAGDPGYDIVILIDFKHIGLLADGSPRLSGHLILRKVPATADRYIAVAGSIATGFWFLGWATKEELLAAPMKDFGYGPKHAIHTKDLRSVA